MLCICCVCDDLFLVLVIFFLLHRWQEALITASSACLSVRINCRKGLFFLCVCDLNHIFSLSFRCEVECTKKPYVCVRVTSKCEFILFDLLSLGSQSAQWEVISLNCYFICTNVIYLYLFSFTIIIKQTLLSCTG